MDSAAEELAVLCGKQLPLIERLGHEHWKVRDLAYTALRSEFISHDGDDADRMEALAKYAPIVMGECLRETSPEAFSSLLDTLLYYVKEVPLAISGRYTWKLNKFIKHNNHNKFSTDHQRTLVHILAALREKGSWEIMPTFAVDATPMVCHLLDTAEAMGDSTAYLAEAVALLAGWAQGIAVRTRAVEAACGGHAEFLKLWHAAIANDNDGGDRVEGETLLFRPSQQYSLLPEVSAARNTDALAYWAERPPTRSSVRRMDSPELAECLAAFLLHYNARNAHRYVALRDALCDLFDRQAITGASLVGPFRLSEATFTDAVLAAFSRDPRIKRRLGDIPTLRRLHATLERDVQVMQVEQEEFENVSEYPESEDSEEIMQDEEKAGNGPELEMALQEKEDPIAQLKELE